MTAEPLRTPGSRTVDPESATASTATRMLFGHLHTEDAASAVVRRLRTAIGIGVLSDGDRLPKESDLARQLGVTAFSLREALGTLRQEGLIVTRVGKNGGSYVMRPPAGESMVDAELIRLSATELRDLGDWRAALTTFSAFLAARRGDAAAADRLDDCATELETAENASWARRALGRFHVELSAGAQSMRLTRAELVVHEEFDWLMQVLVREPEHRLAVGRSLRTVADAVRAADPDAAWQAGERMVFGMITELMRVRLRAIADAYAGEGHADQPGDLEQALRTVFDRVVTLLEEIAREVGSGHDPGATARELNVRVVHSVLPSFGRLDAVVHGLGFMAEVGLLPDARYWMVWWQRAVDGTFDRDYSHQLDHTRDDFYDYSTKEYLTAPRESRAPHALGPYIDHGGVDDNVVTVSVPVQGGDGSFLGIVAADLRVAVLEQAVSPWLARSDGTCVLLSGSRVLLSNSVRYNVGDVLSGDDELTMSDVGLFGWRIGRTDRAD